jgi:hypothetical protein
VAAPIQGWLQRLSDLFTRPAVPAGVILLAGLIFGLGEVQSRPIRAQVERERTKQIDREGRMHQALGQYTETMRQDNAVELRAWEKRLLQNDAQMQAVMEQMAGWMRAGGWKGELKPRAEEAVSPELPRLQRVALGVEMVSPRQISERMKESDQARLFRMLRQMAEIPAPHVMRRLEVDQTPAGELRARVELEFFRLKADG